MKKFTAILVCLFFAFQLQAIPPTAPAGKKWIKIENMSDEFDGTSLNTSKWADNDPQWEGRKPARFQPEAISVANGNLQITTGKLANPYSGWTHQGGLVRSLHKATYGYYETKMKGNKTFLSSTFWLFNKRNEFTGCDMRTTELDITENVGINTGGSSWINDMVTKMNSNTHSRGTTCPETPVDQAGGKALLGGNIWDRYYTFGVYWKSATELLFYLDDQYKFTITPPANFDLGMYLRMVVESYDWNPPKDGSDGINGSFTNRTTYYEWTRSWELVVDNNPVVQTPYGGTPQSIPGIIQAENFDNGGEGVAYHDTDVANNGPNVMRESEGVDIEARDGGNCVGWTANGEWLEFTVNALAGTYDLEARVATTTTGKSIIAKLDGNTIGTFSLPNTGGWGTFQTIKISNVALTAGNNKILRLEFVGGGANINWVKFTSVSTTIPVSSVAVSPTSLSIQAGNTGTLSASVSPSNATNKAVSWSSNNTSIASINSSGVVTGVSAGSATITVKTTDGNKTANCTVTVSAVPSAQSPYGGTPWAIPGKIESENYDNGGEGIAYHDLTTINSGNKGRTAEGVDVETCGEGGLNIGWNSATEWQEYTVNVASAGTYEISIRYAANAAGTVNISIGSASTGNTSLPVTGGWQTYQTVTKTISLSAGQQIMRVSTVAPGMNYNFIEIAAVPSGTPNLLLNNGFETGNLASWGSWGNVSVVANNQKSGSYAVTVNGAGAPSQNVAVSPNTTYTVSAFVKVAAAGQFVYLGVKNHDATESSAQLNSTSYAKGTHTFTTGANATAAQIYFYCPNASYQVWGDDFELYVGNPKSASIEKQEVAKEGSFKVYPLPINNSEFTIELNNYESEVQLSFMDIQGRIIYQNSTDLEYLNISSDIFDNPGIYFLRISSKNGIQTQKIIVQ